MGAAQARPYPALLPSTHTHTAHLLTNSTSHAHMPNRYRFVPLPSVLRGEEDERESESEGGAQTDALALGLHGAEAALAGSSALGGELVGVSTGQLAVEGPTDREVSRRITVYW